MHNPAIIVKVVMFHNDLLFYKSQRFKVIPRTMSFSLDCFTEWERKGGVTASVSQTMLNLAMPTSGGGHC